MKDILPLINEFENTLYNDLQKLIIRFGNKKVIELSDVEECENQCLTMISEYKKKCVKLFLCNPSVYNIKFANVFVDRINNITISNQKFLQQMQDLLDD